MKENLTIGNLDANLFLVTDDIKEATELIKEKSIKQFGLKPKTKVKPIKWLLEHA
jgi:hypothetical protein